MGASAQPQGTNALQTLLDSWLTLPFIAFHSLIATFHPHCQVLWLPKVVASGHKLTAAFTSLAFKTGDCNNDWKIQVLLKLRKEFTTLLALPSMQTLCYKPTLWAVDNLVLGVEWMTQHTLQYWCCWMQSFGTAIWRTKHWPKCDTDRLVNSLWGSKRCSKALSVEKG